MPRLALFACAAALLPAAGPEADLLFHADFNGGADARVARGDKRIWRAPSYKEQSAAQPGLPENVVPENGALKFVGKNTRAVFYKAQDNVAFNAKGWTGTVTFRLNLNPDEDLAPGYCDPIQITDKAYNDSAIWVDFTKDDKPRLFRLGVFGALKAWNPNNIESDKNPAFNSRLVVVKQPPFARGRWTHVAITHDGLGSGKGRATLYLDGKPVGTARGIAEAFDWDVARGAIRLGVNYTGLMDDVAIYGRALTGKEIAALAAKR